MSFSERRYDFQSAGAPIFGIRPAPGVSRKHRCPTSQISGHGVAIGSIIGMSPFRKKHDRPATWRRPPLKELFVIRKKVSVIHETENDARLWLLASGHRLPVTRNRSSAVSASSQQRVARNNMY